MTEKNQAYEAALEDFAEQQMSYVFLDIHEELDNIERNVETEASKILINWVRDAVLRVAENYKR